MPYFEILIIIGMIGFNSLFAGYEIALASVNVARLEALVREKRAGAKAAVEMKRRMEASLAVVQLGITLVGATAAATGGAGAESAIEPTLIAQGISPAVAQLLAIALVVAPLTVITIIFGELVPKIFSLRNKEWVCLKMSTAMQWFSYTVWPAVWFLETTVRWITDWSRRGRSGEKEALDQNAMLELQGAAALARISRAIGHREEGIILSASRLATTPISRIMLPAEYIGMLGSEQTLSDAMIAAHREMHTRFPVTEELGNPQRIIGYVNFKDIVAAIRLAPRDPTFRNLIRSITSFDAQESVAHALETLIREHNHIAVVRERGGKIVGMITLEDIVEELVGEIHDEFDRMPSHIVAAGQGWIAGGFVSLAKLRETTGIELAWQGEKPVYTLNDWIVEQLGRPPRGGDEINAGNAMVVVRKVRHVLVQEAYVQTIAIDTGNSMPED